VVDQFKHLTVPTRYKIPVDREFPVDQPFLAIAITGNVLAGLVIFIPYGVIGNAFNRILGAKGFEWRFGGVLDPTRRTPAEPLEGPPEFAED
jgi:hypothetical protein